MLKVSKLADYAVLMSACMAQGQKKEKSATTISAETRLSLPTVRKILKILTKAGILYGRRGVEGGYQFATPDQDVSILDVVEAVDGPISLTECCAYEDYNCAVNDCIMRPHWSLINRVIKDTLAQYKIGQMAHAVDARETLYKEVNQ